MSEKIKRLILIFSICLNIGFLVIAVYAQYQRANHPYGNRHPNKYNTSAIFETVDLNQQQKAEIDQLVQLYRANMLTISKAVAPLKAKLFIGMAETPPMSDEEAQKLNDEMSFLQKKRGDITHQHLKDLRESLNEEQAKEVFKRLAEIQNKWLKKVKPVW